MGIKMASTSKRRAFHGRDTFENAKGGLEFCPHCGELKDPLDSAAQARRHRLGRCAPA
jgi:hypothetical protein